MYEAPSNKHDCFARMIFAKFEDGGRELVTLPKLAYVGILLIFELAVEAGPRINKMLKYRPVFNLRLDSFEGALHTGHIRTSYMAVSEILI